MNLRENDEKCFMSDNRKYISLFFLSQRRKNGKCAKNVWESVSRKKIISQRHNNTVFMHYVKDTCSLFYLFLFFPFGLHFRACFFLISVAFFFAFLVFVPSGFFLSLRLPVCLRLCASILIAVDKLLFLRFHVNAHERHHCYQCAVIMNFMLFNEIPINLRFL